MKEKLIAFFEEYKNLFKEGKSSGDADDVLMNLIGIMGEEEAEQILERLKASSFDL